MSGRGFASLLVLALLTGCSGGVSPAASGGPAETPEPSAPEPPVSEAPEISEAPEVSATPEVLETLEPDPFFSTLPDKFTFFSGAGAWCTYLFLEDDGSFYGSYHDTDMGVQGEEYPYGTVSCCEFQGKFAPPEQVDEYTWSTHVEELELAAEPGTVTYEDGVRYIDSEPYGLNDVDEVLIYLPGLPKADAPEEFVSWTPNFWHSDRATAFDAYGLYNVNGEQGFLGLPD